jgi:structure-specific endonuclease subunit SLX1
MYVYLLYCDNSTYVGATVDLDRRLRQHNKEICGGAKATGKKVSKGQTWRRICYVSGFPDWQSTLQFEWRWKQITRTLERDEPISRRMKALKKLIGLEQSTSKAMPFKEWPVPPEIHFECEETENKFKIFLHI